MQDRAAHFAARIREFADQIEAGTVNVLEISGEDHIENEPNPFGEMRAKPKGLKRLSFLYTVTSPSAAKDAFRSSRA